jgi:hypothetical protein
MPACATRTALDGSSLPILERVCRIGARIRSLYRSRATSAIVPRGPSRTKTTPRRLARDHATNVEAQVHLERAVGTGTPSTRVSRNRKPTTLT